MIPSVDEHLAHLSAAFGLEQALVAPVRWESTSATVVGHVNPLEHRRRTGLLAGPAALAPADVDEANGTLLPAPARPVLVDAVIVAGCAALPTVARASRFAPLGRRIALVDQVDDFDELRVRAAWLEVGVALVEHGKLQIVAFPGDAHGFDDCYASEFAEVVYRSHLALLGAARRHPAVFRRAS